MSYLYNNVFFGWYDYSDTATAVTPISVTGGIDAKLTNNNLGGLAPQNYPIAGATSVYNTTTNQFDFNSLRIGDAVNISFDVYVTTSTNNQEFIIYLSAALGGTSPFQLVASPFYFKIAGQYHVVDTIALKLFSSNSQKNPAELKISSADNCTVEVVGWNVHVLRPNS